MKKIILMMALWLVSSVALADEQFKWCDEMWGGIMLRSYHSNRQANYNENNLGAGIECQFNKKWRAIYGVYRNSVYETSEYIGVTYTWKEWGNWKFATGFVAASGYQDDPKDWGIFPYPVPLLVYEGRKWGVNIPLFPPLVGHTGVMALQIKFKF
jgi:hypothetical protein